MTAAVHRESLAVRCPRCGATPGQRCRNGDEFARIPHLARLQAADIAPLPNEDEEDS
jgi:hypothetical protein